MTDTLLTLAAQGLTHALEAHHDVSERLVEAKRRLAHAEAVARVHGLEVGGQLKSYAELGKNEAERAAAFDLAFIAAHPGARGTVEVLEADLARAKLELEQARLEWDLQRYRVRLLEAQLDNAA